MSGVARTTRSGGTAQATRQQLDELDALLKRMLDLPVNKSEPEEDDAPVVPPPVRPAIPKPEPSKRSYPASYMVVETSTPPRAEEPPAAVSGLGPREVAEEPFESYRAPEPSARGAGGSPAL